MHFQIIIPKCDVLQHEFVSALTYLELFHCLTVSLLVVVFSSDLIRLNFMTVYIHNYSYPSVSETTVLTSSELVCNRSFASSRDNECPQDFNLEFNLSS